MQKFFIGLLCLPLLIAGGIALLGLETPQHFHGTLTETIHVSIDKVWAQLNDINGIPKRRAEIVKIEDQGLNALGLPQWREITDLKGHIDFEIIETLPKQKLVLHMKESSFGVSGSWTYVLQAAGQGTQVTITEDSDTRKIWLRAIMALSGRDANLKREFALLQH